MTLSFKRDSSFLIVGLEPRCGSLTRSAEINRLIPLSEQVRANENEACKGEGQRPTDRPKARKVPRKHRKRGKGLLKLDV
jgi:hypothetical protein